MVPISRLCPPLNDADNPPTTGTEPNSRPSLSTSANTGLPDAAMSRLWARLAEIYGHRWVSQYGDSHGAMDTWQRGLRDLTRDEISAGLRALLTRDDAWPPSLPEFLQLCRKPIPDPAHALYRALPKPRTDPERVAQALDDLRACLRRPSQRDTTPTEPTGTPPCTP